MLNAKHRSAISSAFLLLVVLTGWIGAPVAHEIQHALERAGLMHIHDVRDGVSLRSGCDMLPHLADECLISLTKVQAVGSVQPPVARLFGSDTTWMSLAAQYAGLASPHHNVRGPPTAA
ncbi:MAG: hypothetical protein O3C45_10460 [Bacteroidetes bacterium]|nr:hypothetical protein [Bacteroidota bacterium]